MKRFELNQNIVNEINTNGTLKGITDRFAGMKIVRDTLSNILLSGFEDLQIGNSCYITVPVCFANNVNNIDTSLLLTKAGMFQDVLRLEWTGLETIEASVYYEFKFELIQNPNKDVDGNDDNVLMLHYYLVIPEGLVEEANKNSYLNQFICMKIASLMLKQLIK